MKKVAVIHNTLNSVGGGGRVCLAVIEALKEMNCHVTLITTEPTDWIKLKKIIGEIIKPDEEKAVFPFRIKIFGIYMRLLSFIKLFKSHKKYDLIINTHGDVLPIASNIIYMHYPTFALLKETAVNVKYSKSIFWRLYFYPYEKIQSILVKKMNWNILLTNSEYSRDAIEKYVGAKAKVIYPPVNVSDFLVDNKMCQRKNIVVMCGRFTPEKNYEKALEIAKEMPEIEFKIIGTSSGKVSDNYLSKLRAIIKSNHLANVELLCNYPRKAQITLYKKAKVFLHTMIGEHFGIAVVEAMASGLIPVVHKSGGAWFDILNRGEYGYGYINTKEAVKAIEKALGADGEKLREKIMQRAKSFDKQKFIKSIQEVVCELFNKNKHAV